MSLIGLEKQTRPFVRFAIAVAALLVIWQVSALVVAGQTPPPNRVPPGSGGATFDTVRVLSGNNLARNAGQENQPPVWMTIDTKGASAVVTVGNATRVPLDFNGTIVITLAPSLQPGKVLVSAGSTTVQGSQIVWSGFSLSSGQILPALVSFTSTSTTPAPSDGAPAIQQVAIEAKDPSSSGRVSELVAGAGPTLAAVASAPTALEPGTKPAAATAAASNTANQTVLAVSRDAARNVAAGALALLGCVLLLLLLLASLSLKLGREVRGLRTLAQAPAGLMAVRGTFADAPDLPQRVADLPADAAGRAVAPQLVPSHSVDIAASSTSASDMAMGESDLAIARDRPAGGARLEVSDGAERGKTWSIDGTDLTIGRNHRNGIVLADPRVSDTHARLTSQADGRYLFIDQRSTNGSLINGRLVHEPVVLCDGDMLRIGGTTFVYHAAPPNAL